MQYGCYLSVTASIQALDYLFVLLASAPKRCPAFCSTISSWIRQVITLISLFKAHLNNLVSTSWVFQHHASAYYICKAATWSSVYTFVKYQVEGSLSWGTDCFEPIGICSVLEVFILYCTIKLISTQKWNFRFKYS